MSYINRRHVLTALPLAGASLTLPVLADAAAAERDTPMKAAYRQWKAHLVSMVEIEGEAAFDAAHDRLLEIDNHMRAQPCLNAEDVLILLAAQTRWGESYDHDWPEHMPEDARAIVDRVLA
ncbi:hypothetical protein [Paracoccus sp. (in: a-proteobacteria)]|uniref:hypothetical protein n=1 Tax=Paracoccus sp. TaxID=267 RepID=UPI0035B1418B